MEGFQALLEVKWLTEMMTFDLKYYILGLKVFKMRRKEEQQRRQRGRWRSKRENWRRKRRRGDLRRPRWFDLLECFGFSVFALFASGPIVLPRARDGVVVWRGGRTSTGLPGRSSFPSTGNFCKTNLSNSSPTKISYTTPRSSPSKIWVINEIFFSFITIPLRANVKAPKQWKPPIIVVQAWHDPLAVRGRAKRRRRGRHHEVLLVMCRYPSSQKATIAFDF